jgi:hypothetical protein
MAVSIKKKPIKSKKVSIKAPRVVVDKSMRDYSNEPFFIKKADAAKKFIDEHGFPKNFFK